MPDNAAGDAEVERIVEKIAKDTGGIFGLEDVFQESVKREIRKAIAAGREMSREWKLIDSAPKDTAILVYACGYFVAHFNTFYGKWIAMGCDTIDTITLNRLGPTHWMNLPGLADTGKKGCSPGLLSTVPSAEYRRGVRECIAKCRDECSTIKRYDLGGGFVEVIALHEEDIDGIEKQLLGGSDGDKGKADEITRLRAALEKIRDAHQDNSYGGCVRCVNPLDDGRDCAWPCEMHKIASKALAYDGGGEIKDKANG